MPRVDVPRRPAADSDTDSANPTPQTALSRPISTYSDSDDENDEKPPRAQQPLAADPTPLRSQAPALSLTSPPAPGPPGEAEPSVQPPNIDSPAAGNPKSMRRFSKGKAAAGKAPPSKPTTPIDLNLNRLENPTPKVASLALDSRRPLPLPTPAPGVIIPQPEFTATPPTPRPLPKLLPPSRSLKQQRSVELFPELANDTGADDPQNLEATATAHTTTTTTAMKTKVDTTSVARPRPPAETRESQVLVETAAAGMNLPASRPSPPAVKTNSDPTTTTQLARHPSVSVASALKAERSENGGKVVVGSTTSKSKPTPRRAAAHTADKGPRGRSDRQARVSAEGPRGEETIADAALAQEARGVGVDAMVALRVDGRVEPQEEQPSAFRSPPSAPFFPFPPSSDPQIITAADHHLYPDPQATAGVSAVHSSTPPRDAPHPPPTPRPPATATQQPRLVVGSEPPPSAAAAAAAAHLTSLHNRSLLDCLATCSEPLNERPSPSLALRPRRTHTTATGKRVTLLEKEKTTAHLSPEEGPVLFGALFVLRSNPFCS
jgi:hypothetical protein